MDSDPTTTPTLDYASAPRRRRLAEVIDVELWMVVGVVVALLVLDFACILFILLR